MRWVYACPLTPVPHHPHHPGPKVFLEHQRRTPDAYWWKGGPTVQSTATSSSTALTVRYCQKELWLSAQVDIWVTTYLCPAFSFLKIAWAESENLGLSPAMREKSEAEESNPRLTTWIVINRWSHLFISRRSRTGVQCGLFWWQR
jgi:hypothetical protein